MGTLAQRIVTANRHFVSEHCSVWWESGQRVYLFILILVQHLREAFGGVPMVMETAIISY